MFAFGATIGVAWGSSGGVGVAAGAWVALNVFLDDARHSNWCENEGWRPTRGDARRVRGPCGARLDPADYWTVKGSVTSQPAPVVSRKFHTNSQLPGSVAGIPT